MRPDQQEGCAAALASFVVAAAGSVLGSANGDAVGAAFAVASEGLPADGRSGLDGRPASTIHPSGVPLELSVTGGAETDPVLRYTTEAGARWPFLARRIASQRAALAALIAGLPAPAAAQAAALVDEVTQLAFPEVAAVPTRTRLGTLTGVVHRRDQPTAPAGLKLYANADHGAAARLADHWPEVANEVAPVADEPALRLHFVAAETGRSGVVRKAYLRTVAPMDGPRLGGLLERFALDPGRLLVAVDEAGLGSSLRRRAVFVCRARHPGGVVATTVHLQLGPAGDDRARLEAARRFATSWVGTDAVVGAAAAAGAAGEAATGIPWVPTLVAARLPAPGAEARLNVYLAPVPSE